MTRPGKAVETAALWKPWKWTHREADQRIRFFPPLPQRLENGLALLARFPQLHTASTAGYTNRFHPELFTGPGIDPKRSTNALLTGIQHTAPGQHAVQPLHRELHEGLK